jgi:hypothetical protein
MHRARSDGIVDSYAPGVAGAGLGARAMRKLGPP